MINPQAYRKKPADPVQAVQVPEDSGDGGHLSTLAEIAEWCGGRAIIEYDEKVTDGWGWRLIVTGMSGEKVRASPTTFVVKHALKRDFDRPRLEAMTAAEFWAMYQPVDAAPPDHPYPQPACDPAPPSISDAIDIVLSDPDIGVLFETPITGENLGGILRHYAHHLRRMAQDHDLYTPSTPKKETSHG